MALLKIAKTGHEFLHNEFPSCHPNNSNPTKKLDEIKMLKKKQHLLSSAFAK